MQGLATAFAVMRKDLFDFLNNRALLVSMLATICIAIGFVKLSDRMSRAVRLDLVGGAASRFRIILGVAQVFQLKDAPDEAAAAEDVRLGRADFALLIPTDFDKAMTTGTTPSVTIITRTDAGPRAAVGLSALTEMLRLYAGQKPPVSLGIRTVGSVDATQGKVRMVSGWLLFVLMMGMTIVAASLVEERERGTLQAILVTPAGLWGVLVGKGLHGFVVSFSAVLVIAASCGLFSGSGTGGAVMLVLGAAFAASLGLWLGVLFPNMASANAGLSVVFLVLFVPVFLSDVLQGTPLGAGWTHLLPSFTLLDGLQQAFGEGAGWAGIRGSVAVLTGWTVVAGATSWFWIRAEMAR